MITSFELLLFLLFITVAKFRKICEERKFEVEFLFELKFVFFSSFFNSIAGIKHRRHKGKQTRTTTVMA